MTRNQLLAAAATAAAVVAGAGGVLLLRSHSTAVHHAAQGGVSTRAEFGFLHEPDIIDLLTSTRGTPPPTPAPTPQAATSSPGGGTSGGGQTTARSRTHWHFTANSNFDASGNFLPGADGFNIADVSSVDEVNRLPAGDKGMVWVGMCGGATSSFASYVQPFAGNSRVFGFYLMDEPDPASCTASNLAQESDWIHAHVPGTYTFIIMMNLGADESPTYAEPAGSYTPQNSHLDLVALDPYPVRGGNPDYGEITRSVAAAKAIGWSQASIVPVYQAFGGGNWSGGWTLPTVAEEQQILAAWAAVVPSPVFDYAYSWGSQNGDTALSQSAALQQVFAAHNR
jgi:hypothetical protein